MRPWRVAQVRRRAAPGGGGRRGREARRCRLAGGLGGGAEPARRGRRGRGARAVAADDRRGPVLGAAAHGGGRGRRGRPWSPTRRRWPGGAARASAGCGLAAAVTAAALMALTAAALRDPAAGARCGAGRGRRSPPARRWRWRRWTATGCGSRCSPSGSGSRWSRRRRRGTARAGCAGVLLAASSWVRLSLADVGAPEAYTVPGGRRAAGAGRPAAPARPGVRLLERLRQRAVPRAGAEPAPRRHRRRRPAPAAAGRRRRRRCWRSAWPGGCRHRSCWVPRCSPIDALVQLAPYLAAAYDAVPRWVTIGVARAGAAGCRSDVRAAGP